MAKRSFSIPRPVQYAVLGVAVIAAGAMVWSAFQPVTPPVSSSTREALQPEDFATEDAENTTALFIGDSYTHGTGASDKSLRWSTLVAGTAGWFEVNEALGGTGFVTTSSVNGCGRDYCGTYSEVIESLSVDPAVVVIAGGQNDFRAFAADPAGVSAAIQSTYNLARERFPEARIISVGPSIIGQVSETVVAFDAAVQAAASSVGAEYVTLISPDALDGSMDAGDGGHVNDTGHRAIADRVVTIL